MKHLFLFAFTAILFVACKEPPQQRYFSESTETEILKSGIEAYETANWDKWKSHFSDTAKIFVNSVKHTTVDKRAKALEAMAGAMSSYGFNHDKEYIEMVLDKENETWVYYWATHNNTFAKSNKKLSIPVHLAVQFVDGKIVEEHIYFNETEMNAEFAALSEVQTDTINSEI
ncbi:hypothetical protein [uncultured Algibacter sp.]|uniref:nuclear transport factor 2 family protein n=1 Tax=uncultured Algibacter sp. TaxID=298659 RepID=UPI00260D4206|nr:hypothetical protein [uncultured Algibacter sp.]